MSRTMVSGWQKKVFNRRTFFGLCGVGAAGAGYMRLAEAEWLEVNEPTLTLAKAGEEIRVLHMSDFHASDVVSLDYIGKAVDLGVAQKPDLICLTGDFITSRYEKFSEYGEILKRLAKAAPAFACIGNHDGGAWVSKGGRGYKDWELVRETLNGAGVEVLHNRSAIVEARGRALQLVGLGDLWAAELNPGLAFAKARTDLKTIALSHNPDSKEFLGGYRWDLMLCGHTHGGQMWVPLFGAPFAPVRDKRYVAGLKEWRDRWIHVTKGIGNLHGMRLNCRPEVSLLRVRI